jgi:hypothetical protein
MKRRNLYEEMQDNVSVVDGSFDLVGRDSFRGGHGLQKFHHRPGQDIQG